MRSGVVWSVPVLAPPMTTLDDKAETPETTAYSIEDAADSGAEFRVRSLELDPANEVGTDAFPQYGDWLAVEELRDGAALGDVHVECPRGLAAELVEQEADEGDAFAIHSVEKTANGEWSADVQVRG